MHTHYALIESLDEEITHLCKSAEIVDRAYSIFALHKSNGWLGSSAADLKVKHNKKQFRRFDSCALTN